MKNTKSIAFVLSALAVSAIVGCVVLAWTEPGSPAPGGNVAAPINTGSNVQTKTGGLNVSGNVGIGTTSPAQKLDVVGTAAVNYLRVNPQDATNEGGELQLGGSGSYGTFQIDNYQGNARIFTLATGKQFQVLGGSIYADGSANNYLAGNVGIGTNNPSAKLEIAGQIKITGGSPGDGKVLTSDANGMATWTAPSSATIADMDCGTNGYVTGIKGGKLVCGDKGTFDPSVPCSSGPLGGPNKRIFVTSTAYDASTFVTNINSASHVYTSSETIADAKCQDLAYAGNMTTRNSTNGATGANAAIFKAIVYMGNRNITSVFPAAKLWSCDANSTNHWKQVANDMTDMFDASALTSRIYTQYGIASTADVWTNFKSNGNGGYILITPQTGFRGGYPSFGFGGNCLLGAYSAPPNCSGWNCYTAAESWYGKADQTGAGWAYAGNFQVKDKCCYDLTSSWYACMSQVKALYCVEQ